MALGSGQFSGQKAAVPHLVAGKGGVSGEVNDLRRDIGRDFAANAAIAIEEFTDVPAAAASAIRNAAATVTTARTLSGSQLDGTIGSGVISPPRNIVVTTAGGTPANAPANVTINGLDVNGDAISETIAVAQTATTAVGNKAFAKVTSISEEAADGTAATLAYGTGVKIGLGKKLKARAGASMVLGEVTGGTLLGIGAITGTFAAPATGAPNGTYAPVTAPNGSLDYAVLYEYDASLNK